MFKQMLIPTDGSEPAAQAVDQGVAPAVRIGASVTTLTATEPFHILSTDAMRVESSRASGPRGTGGPLPGCWPKSITHGMTAPVKEILDTAFGEGCALIAMAPRRRRGMAAAMTGSRATRIPTPSKIPAPGCR